MSNVGMPHPDQLTMPNDELAPIPPLPPGWESNQTHYFVWGFDVSEEAKIYGTFSEPFSKPVDFAQVLQGQEWANPMPDSTYDAHEAPPGLPDLFLHCCHSKESPESTSEPTFPSRDWSLIAGIHFPGYSEELSEIRPTSKQLRLLRECLNAEPEWFKSYFPKTELLDS
jgi:hypothetical protein